MINWFCVLIAAGAMLIATTGALNAPNGITIPCAVACGFFLGTSLILAIQYRQREREREVRQELNHFKSQQGEEQWN